MKIGFNSRCLEYSQSGIERYAKEVLSGVVKSDNITKVSLFSQIPLVNNLNDFHSNKLDNWHSDEVYGKFSALRKFQWEAMTLGAAVNNSDIELFHAPSFILPLVSLSDCKSVITVHDLAFLKHPECFDFKTRFFYLSMFKSSLCKASRIICISNSTYVDLLDFYPDVKNKIDVIYNGFEDFSKYSQDTSILERYGLEANHYWLTVGTINRRKNLINAYNSFKAVNSGSHYKLVLVGKECNLPAHILTDDQVVVTGYVSESDLANLYRFCFSFLFVSLYEGFGFPILEAQSLGKPVVCSNISSLPEVCGYKTQYLVDPLSCDSISSRINELQQSPSLYEDMVGQGRENIHRFSWSKMRKETLALYEYCMDY